MKAAEFETSNVHFTADGCDPLPARRYVCDARGLENAIGPFVCVESRWLPTEAERHALLNGGAIVLKLFATNPQPTQLRVILDDRLIET